MAFDFFANPAGKKAKKRKSKSKSKKSKSGARKVVAKRPKAAKKRVSHKRASRKGKRRAPKRKVTRGIATLTGCKIKIRKARKGESFAHVLKKMPKAGRPRRRRGSKRGRAAAMRPNPYNPFAAFLNPAPKKGAAKRGRPKKSKSKSKSRRGVSHSGGVTVARVVKLEKGLSATNGRVRKLATHVTKLDHRTANMNKIREAVGIPRLPTDVGTLRGH